MLRKDLYMPLPDHDDHILMLEYPMSFGAHFYKLEVVEHCSVAAEPVGTCGTCTIIEYGRESLR